jgi:SET domain-containing protein
MKKVSKKNIEQQFNNQINLLNDIVKIKLRPSNIHGVGVFAIRDIKKDEKLYTDVIPHAFDLPYKMFNKLDKEVSELILNSWPNIYNGAHFLYPITKMTAFINHSEKPNYDINKDVALADIKSGDEITINYKLYKNSEKIFKWLK